MKGTFSASQTASRRTHAVDSTRNTTRKSRSRNSPKKRTSRKNAPPVPYAHSARVPAVRCDGERNLTGEKKAWCADSFRIGKRVGQKYLAMFPGLTTRGGSRRTFLETVVVKYHTKASEAIPEFPTSGAESASVSGFEKVVPLPHPLVEKASIAREGRLSHHSTQSSSRAFAHAHAHARVTSADGFTDSSQIVAMASTAPRAVSALCVRSKPASSVKRTHFAVGGSKTGVKSRAGPPRRSVGVTRASSSSSDEPSLGLQIEQALLDAFPTRYVLLCFHGVSS